MLYHLELPEALKVTIQITNRIFLFSHDPRETPHGPLKRLPSTFPLHWDILTPYADARVDIQKGGVALVQSKGIARTWLAFTLDLFY